MKKTLKFGGLLVAAIVTASIIAALDFPTTSTFAQNATSGNKTTTAGGNTTSGNTTSSSSAMPKSATSSSAAQVPKY